MSLVVTRACRPWWNYQVHDLAKGEVIPDGEFADFLLEVGAPVLEQAGTTPAVDGDGVPDGTAKDVLGWVGDDPARAALALHAETLRGRPRSTVLAGLEKFAVAGPIPGPDVVDPADADTPPEQTDGSPAVDGDAPTDGPAADVADPTAPADAAIEQMDGGA